MSDPYFLLQPPNKWKLTYLTPGMRAMRTLDRQQHGRTRASILPECKVLPLVRCTPLTVTTTHLRKRVFILGPSHHVRLDGCALSKCTQYETPIGSLPLDLESEPSNTLRRITLIAACLLAIAQLRATGKFMAMGLEVDEDEHSIEMQLPYVRKIFEGYDICRIHVFVYYVVLTLEAEQGSTSILFLSWLEAFLKSPKPHMVVY